MSSCRVGNYYNSHATTSLVVQFTYSYVLEIGVGRTWLILIMWWRLSNSVMGRTRVRQRWTWTMGPRTRLHHYNFYRLVRDRSDICTVLAWLYIVGTPWYCNKSHKSNPLLCEQCLRQVQCWQVWVWYTLKSPAVWPMWHPEPHTRHSPIPSAELEGTQARE